MKKIMMMAMMAFGATYAFAGDSPALKEILKAKTYAEASTLLNSTIGQLASNAEKAKAYNKLVDLALDKFNKENTIVAENTVLKQDKAYDKAGMEEAAINALKAANECDKYDQLPNEKGKVSPQYRKKNESRLQQARNSIINVGLDAYNSQNRQQAYELFTLYCDAKNNPLYESFDFSKDQYLGQVAYYASLTAYQLQDFNNAIKYADIALADTAVAKDAVEIKVFCMKDNAKTKEDSVKYLNVIKDMHAQEPDNERYFGLLMEYYSSPGHTEEMKKFIADESVRDPNNKMVWALKGEQEMNARNWDDAVTAYKQAVSIDPDWVQVLFNIGVCLNSKAMEFKDKVADKLGRLTNDDMNTFKNVLDESRQYMEKCRELDGNHELVNWPYPLYQIYYILYGDNDSRTQEMKTITGM